VNEKNNILSEINSHPEMVLNQLIRENSANFYKVILRMVVNATDAEDVLQNAFIKIWQNLHQYKADSSLFSWSYRIVINECLQFLRRKKVKHLFLLENYTDKLIGFTYQNPVNENKIEQILQQAILQLPEKQRIIFNMRYFNELTNEQIAEIMQVHIGTVKTQYHHAVKKIENYLKQYSTFL
jgi:RNA polymerase sigma factor (sigma-70 family)